MDYPCAKFGDFCLSSFDFIVRTDRQNTEAILTRLPSASAVAVLGMG